MARRHDTEKPGRLKRTPSLFTTFSKAVNKTPVALGRSALRVRVWLRPCSAHRNHQLALFATLVALGVKQRRLTGRTTTLGYRQYHYRPFKFTSTNGDGIACFDFTRRLDAFAVDFGLAAV